MPPSVKIKKEDIIEAGYLIAAEEGLEGINARSIAKKLKCSIQPIFSNFKTMDVLKNIIIEKILETYKNYIADGTKESSPYKGMGKAYIKFAKEEPKLFQILFMSNHKLNSKNFIPSDEVKNLIMIHGRNKTKLTTEEMEKFHFKIWIFTHGIATLIATNTCTFKEEEIDNMLTEIFYGLLNSKEEKE